MRKSMCTCACLLYVYVCVYACHAWRCIYFSLNSFFFLQVMQIIAKNIPCFLVSPTPRLSRIASRRAWLDSNLRSTSNWDLVTTRRSGVVRVDRFFFWLLFVCEYSGGCCWRLSFPSLELRESRGASLVFPYRVFSRVRTTTGEGETANVDSARPFRCLWQENRCTV